MIQPIIFEPVKDALSGMFVGFCEASNKKGIKVNKEEAAEVFSELVTIFNQFGAFLDKLKKSDDVFEKHKDFLPLKELCFDLLMINFLAVDAENLPEDYLESEEWLGIEDSTIDRGTELLHVFLYIQEAEEADVKIGLDDYLNEFLLVEDDLYQDEFVLYESLIQNREILDGTVEKVLEVEKKMVAPEIKEVFLPLILFFENPENIENNFESVVGHSSDVQFQAAVLVSLFAFKNGVEKLPETFTNFLNK